MRAAKGPAPIEADSGEHRSPESGISGEQLHRPMLHIAAAEHCSVLEQAPPSGSFIVIAEYQVECI